MGLLLSFCRQAYHSPSNSIAFSHHFFLALFWRTLPMSLNRPASIDQRQSIAVSKFPVPLASCGNSYGAPHTLDLRLAHVQQRHQDLLRQMRRKGK